MIFYFRRVECVHPSFSSISLIISFMVAMIGYVKEIRLMYQFAVATLEDFLKVSLILILYDVRSR